MGGLDGLRLRKRRRRERRSGLRARFSMAPRTWESDWRGRRTLVRSFTCVLAAVFLGAGEGEGLAG